MSWVSSAISDGAITLGCTCVVCVEDRESNPTTERPLKGAPGKDSVLNF